jgi:hypothetical protein
MIRSEVYFSATRRAFGLGPEDHTLKHQLEVLHLRTATRIHRAASRAVGPQLFMLDPLTNTDTDGIPHMSEPESGKAPSLAA